MSIAGAVGEVAAKVFSARNKRYAKALLTSKKVGIYAASGAAAGAGYGMYDKDVGVMRGAIRGAALGVGARYGVKGARTGVGRGLRNMRAARDAKVATYFGGATMQPTTKAEGMWKESQATVKARGRTVTPDIRAQLDRRQNPSAYGPGVKIGRTAMPSAGSVGRVSIGSKA